MDSAGLWFAWERGRIWRRKAERHGWDGIGWYNGLSGSSRIVKGNGLMRRKLGVYVKKGLKRIKQMNTFVSTSSWTLYARDTLFYLLPNLPPLPLAFEFLFLILSLRKLVCARALTFVGLRSFLSPAPS